MQDSRKIALVTGAGSGIGRGVALGLAEAGFDVILAGRRKDALEETARLAVVPSRHLSVPTDVCDDASVAALFAAIDATFGRLDLVFNNAGTGAPAVEFDELTLSQWSSVVATNLTGAFLVAQGAFRMMKAQSPRGGRIINNGSVSATSPRPLSAPYTATKHAITGLTKSLSLDGRPYDIACGQIDVGNAASAMTERMTLGVLQADGRLATEPRIDLGHIVKGVLYMAELPLEANVQFMTVMATTMPFIGRG